MHENQIDELLQTCEEAARAGGQELLAWRGRFSTREKGVADYVTDADLASQAAVRRVIASRFPQHDFIGEEQPPESFASRTHQLHWIVDPLDGTTNYITTYRAMRCRSRSRAARNCWPVSCTIRSMTCATPQARARGPRVMA
jgi:3'-phosphoadenosine 5'-phosphosulfate (PAPS) 3'-phosphatase